MKRLLTVVGLVSVAVMGFTVVANMKLFDATYGVKPDSKLGAAKCMVCHTSMKGKSLNAFGKDIQTAMKAEGTKKMTVEILRKVEKLDSNKNGVSNIDEIKADQLPGASK